MKYEKKVSVLWTQTLPQPQTLSLSRNITSNNTTTKTMSSMTTTAAATLETLSALALKQFVILFGEVCEDEGIEAPEELTGDNLYNSMYKKMTNGKSPQLKKGFVRKSSEDADFDTMKPISRDDDDVDTQETTLSNINDVPDAQVTSTKIEAKLLKTVATYEKKTKKVKKVEKDESGEGKVVTEVEEEVDVPNVIDLPYLPHCVDYSGCCQALKVNGGLFTPCLTRPAKNSEYCKICSKDLKYGTIKDRQSVPIGTYMDPQGKKEISYGTWLEKRKIERSFVEDLIMQKLGGAISIPESYFRVDKSRVRKVTKKSPSTSSDDETGSVETSEEQTTKTTEVTASPKTNTKRRGRPPKVTKTIVEEEPVVVEETVKPTPAPVVEDTASEIVFHEKTPDEDDEYTYFTYKGRSYAFDEDNTLIELLDDDELEMVGSWDPVEKKPVFTDGKEP